MKLSQLLKLLNNCCLSYVNVLKENKKKNKKRRKTARHI